MSAAWQLGSLASGSCEDSFEFVPWELVVLVSVEAFVAAGAWVAAGIWVAAGVWVAAEAWGAAEA